MTSTLAPSRSSLLGRISRPTLFGGLAAASILYVGILSLFGGGDAAVRNLNEDGTVKARVTRSERTDNTFKIGVSVAVTDASDKVIPGLSTADFEAYEDGTRVQIFDFVVAGQQPIRVALVIDHSGSMSSEGRIEGARKAATTFLGLMHDGIDSIGIYPFDDRVENELPVAPLDPATRAAVLSRISTLQPRGGTELYGALLKALDGMQYIKGRRIILAMTDGVSGGEHQIPSVIELARKTNIPLYTIGLGSEAGVRVDVLRRLAEETGGQYFPAATADQLASLYRTIGETLQNEYSFTYESPSPVEDGLNRTVVVAVRRGDSGAKAKGGYFVPGIVTVGSKRPAAATPGSSEASQSEDSGPFLAIFLPLAALLGLAFGVPYWQMLRGPATAAAATAQPSAKASTSAAASPAVSSATPTVPPASRPPVPSATAAPIVAPVVPAPSPTAAPQPSPPVATPTTPEAPSSRDPNACPGCGRVHPGAKGRRYCFVCEMNY